MDIDYKNENSLEKRREESEKVIKKFPDTCPVIIESNKKKFKLDKKKFVVPNELTIAQLITKIRKRLETDSIEKAEKEGKNAKPTFKNTEALYFLVNNNTLVPSGKTIKEIYEEYKDIDGFLYILVQGENTFG
jgi:GABA(A) receptor-associated protein